jgi:hypothetical protein
MENFRFTLFNSITLLLMALTLAMAWPRHLRGPRRKWALVYWAMVLGYAIGFKYSYDLRWVAAGLAATVGVLQEHRAAGLRYLRIAESFALCYIFARSLGLILLW